MGPTNAKRGQTLSLLSGPTMQVTLTTSTGSKKKWGLPKALLRHHAGYFRRLRNFKEGEEDAVTLEGFEPEIFELFVEFIYFGKYTCRDDLSDPTRIRDSSKAWVLGFYLDAVNLKNFAIENLHDIYFSQNGQDAKSSIGPEMVSYCCAMAPEESKLSNFIRDVLIVHWHRNDIVLYHNTNYSEWEAIWEEHAWLRSDVLYWTNQSLNDRLGDFHRDLMEYTEGLVSADELRATEVLLKSSTV